MGASWGDGFNYYSYNMKFFGEGLKILFLYHYMPNSIYPSGMWGESQIVAAFEKVISSREIKDLRKIKSNDLADSAAWRVYTEWCMDPSPDGGGSNWEYHRKYSGKALGQFLDDEKLWEAIDPNRGKNRLRDYESECCRILDAFARSALDYFLVHCELSSAGNYIEKERDTTDIRRSLQPWLDNPDLI